MSKSESENVFKSGMSAGSVFDDVPSTKGRIRLLASSRKMHEPNYFPEYARLVQNDPLHKNRTFRGGLNGDAIKEHVPEHNTADYEKVLKNDNNAFIIIGRDRPASKSSGYGNLGATNAGSIYIIAGKAMPPDLKGKAEVISDNNLKTDAAGIYISQLTDIDNNYELARGSLSSVAKSGIGVKADSVRIIARENIKLVTGPFVREQVGGIGKTLSSYGIDIIAGNDDSTLQPMVLGKNLASCITELADIVTDVSSLLDSMVIIQQDFDKSLSSHIHPGSKTIDGALVSIEADVAIKQARSIKASRTAQEISTQMITFKENMAKFKKKYLDGMAPVSIMSSKNKVN
jgi:hypothetical protein